MTWPLVCDRISSFVSSRNNMNQYFSNCIGIFHLKNNFLTQYCIWRVLWALSTSLHLFLLGLRYHHTSRIYKHSKVSKSLKAASLDWPCLQLGLSPGELYRFSFRFTWRNLMNNHQSLECLFSAPPKRPPSSSPHSRSCNLEDKNTRLDHSFTHNRFSTKCTTVSHPSPARPSPAAWWCHLCENWASSGRLSQSFALQSHNLSPAKKKEITFFCTVTCYVVRMYSIWTEVHPQFDSSATASVADLPQISQKMLLHSVCTDEGGKRNSLQGKITTSTAPEQLLSFDVHVLTDTVFRLLLLAELGTKKWQETKWVSFTDVFL